MSACGRQRRWKSFVTISFAVLALVCMAGLFVTIHVPLAQETGGGEPICPLSAHQQKEADEAFKKLAQIFKDPRCINCHGLLNPFERITKHPGGFIDIKKTLKERLKQARSIRAQYPGADEKELDRFEKDAETEIQEIERENISHIVDIEVEGKNLPAADLIMKNLCEECHSEPPTWRIPQRRNNWFTSDGVKPRTDEDLCIHMKEVFPDAEAFLNHMNGDQLIQVAFAGTRALNENGKLAYQELNKKPFKAKGPEMSKDEMMKWANEWVKAMGGKFPKPDDCGCSQKKYQMSVKQHWTVNANMGIVTSRLESETAFLMDLLFEAEGKFTGHATVPRTFDEHQTGLGSVCDGKAMWFETWKTTGIMNEESGEMQVKARFDASPKEGVGTCQTKIGTFKKPIRTPAINSDSVPTPMRSGFTMPARVGEKQHFEWEFPPAKNTVDFSIVEEQSSPRSGTP
jgi:hypothetical protein